MLPAIQDVDRLEALESFAILDTSAEEGFDDVVYLAAQMCACPVALVSFVAKDRQWFKARIGFPPCETDLDSSVCAYALDAPDLLVIPDLTLDPRTRANPLVTGPPYIRFYAGAPLRTAEGQTLGSLCVIDFEPRPDGLSPSQAQNLRVLGRQVMSLLELRRALASRDNLLVEQGTALREREVLRATQTAVSNAGGDTDAIFDALLAGAMQAVPAADAGVIELIDGAELVYRGVRGSVVAHRGLRVPMTGSLAGACASRNEAILVPDVAEDPRAAHNFVQALGLRSAVLVPVSRGGHVVGVLKLQSKQVNAFTPHDLQVTQLFASAVTAGLTEASEAAAARAVQTSESRYRAIFESATDVAIIATNRSGIVTNWNVGATRILGWSAQEMVGTATACFFTEEDTAAGQIGAEMHTALQTGRAIDERWHVRKDGSRFWASGEMMPLRDRDAALGFLKIFRDRTTEYQADAALKNTEALLRRAQTVGGVGVFHIDLATDLIYATPEFCRLHGLPERDCFPTTVVDAIIHPEDVELRSGAAARAKGDVRSRVVYRIVRADNASVRWISRWAEIERDGLDRPQRMVGTAHDITEQVLTQQRLAAEREQLAQLFEQAPTFMAMLRGAEHRFERVNPGYTKLVDGRPLVGRTFAEALPEVVEQGHLDLLDEVFRSGEPYSADGRKFIVQAADGGPAHERYVDLVYQPIRNPDGKVSGIFIEGVDATASSLASAELREDERRQKALLELADKIHDIGDPVELATVSSQILGHTLGVGNVGYGVVDTVAETIFIEGGWRAHDATSFAGTLCFRDYGTYIEDLKRGQTVAIFDVGADHRTRDKQAALEGIRVRAFVNMPVLEHGRFVALLYATHSEARVWSDGDLRFIREVAERVRIATERLRSERALRESEDQFRAFAQVMPNHVWAASHDGQLYWVNQQTYAYCGAAPGELDGSGWISFVHPDDVAQAAQAWSKALASASIYETQFRMRGLDGQYRFFLVRAEPIRSADGSVLRWIGTNTDIQDQKTITETLSRLNEDLEQQVEERTRDRDRMWRLSTDVMLVAGFDGTVVSVNPAWSKLLGWSEGELLRRSFMEFVHPEDVAATLQAVGTLSDGSTIPRFENRYRSKDGSYRWLSWTAVPDEDFIHAVGRDVSAEKDAAEALRRTEEALRQSQKMEAVGQLTGGLAHDFNNLLTGITGSLDLIGTRIAQGRHKDTERYINAAQDAAKRAAALTHRLLAFSRRQTLDPKPTDVNRLMGGMVDLIRRTVGPGVIVETVAAADLWPTLVDSNQLENALLNLCINARDAMPDGGQLVIETANCRLDARAARDRELAPGEYISLSVSDDGTGMPPEVIAKAFEPFFTTKPLGKGTGLGLSMIYGFARQSGGQVRISSKPGAGTSVSIYLPRHFGEIESADASPGKSDVPRAGVGETVLVVDDEPTVRMLVTEVLEELGYAAAEAADGAAGLRILQSDVRIDLLVTDVGLPGGMNGRQMADAARLTRPDLKILFITGFAEAAVVGNGHLERGMHVMTKPFAMDAFASRIKSLITEG